VHPKGHARAGHLTSPPEFEYVSHDNILNHVDLSPKETPPEAPEIPSETPKTETEPIVEEEKKREQLTDFISWNPDTQVAQVDAEEVSFDLEKHLVCEMTEQLDSEQNTRLRFEYNDNNFLEFSALGEDDYAFTILLQGKNPEVLGDDGITRIPLLGVKVKKTGITEAMRKFVSIVKTLDISQGAEPIPDDIEEEGAPDQAEGEEEKESPLENEPVVEQVSKPDTELRERVDALLERQLGRELTGDAVDEELKRIQKIEAALEKRDREYTEELREKISDSIKKLWKIDENRIRLRYGLENLDEKFLQFVQDTTKIQSLLSVFDTPENVQIFNFQEIILSNSPDGSNIEIVSTQQIYIGTNTTPEEIQDFFDTAKVAKKAQETFFQSLESLPLQLTYYPYQVISFDQAFIDTHIGTEGVKHLKKLGEFLRNTFPEKKSGRVAISTQDSSTLFQYNKEQNMIILTPKAGWDNWEEALRTTLSNTPPKS